MVFMVVDRFLSHDVNVSLSFFFAFNFSSCQDAYILFNFKKKPFGNIKFGWSILLLANFWIGSDKVNSDSTSLNICQIGYELELKWVAKLITVTLIMDWQSGQI